MKKILFLTACLMLISSCGGKKEVKTVSPDSQTTQEAFSLAEKVIAAYSKRDMEALRANTTADAYREIIGSMKDFNSAEVSFTPRWVEIQRDGTVTVNISWNGKWTLRGAVAEERGMAVFLLEGSPLRLGKVLRGSPFIYPE